jgi:hypothetical protein
MSILIKKIHILNYKYKFEGGYSMNLQDILNQKVLLVVINNSVCTTSTEEQIKEATLSAWKMNTKKASKIEYVIGLKNGIGVSCYKVDEIQIRKEDGRIIFKSNEDLSNIVKGINFKEMGVRKGYKEIQYINID